MTNGENALGGGAAVVVLFGAMLTYYEFFRTVPPPYFASDEEHFLYGSIGTEATAGVPYWIWLVLPRVFPDKLPYPGGYESLGIVAQEGTRTADRIFETDDRHRARRYQLRLLSYRDYRKSPAAKAGDRAGRTQSHDQPARLSALPVCLRC